MSDHINRAVQVIENLVSLDIPGWRWRYTSRIAEALDAAGLLATPEHDAAVAAKALREAADGFSDPDDPCHDPEPLNEVAQWLRLMAAERIEREGGRDA